jgi:hypothetical protein
MIGRIRRAVVWLALVAAGATVTLILVREHTHKDWTTGQARDHYSAIMAPVDADLARIRSSPSDPAYLCPEVGSAVVNAAHDLNVGRWPADARAPISELISGLRVAYSSIAACVQMASSLPLSSGLDLSTEENAVEVALSDTPPRYSS